MGVIGSVFHSSFITYHSSLNFDPSRPPALAPSRSMLCHLRLTEVICVMVGEHD